MIDHSVPKFIAIAGITALLAGCSSWGGSVGEIPKNNAETGGAVDGADDTLLGEDGLSLNRLINGNDSAANALPVNKYLWRGALDTLSFLPLASADPFSGTIATDWGGTPGAPSERVRVTAYVEGKELTARALDVSVFREELNGGAWVAAPVSPQTAEQIKDKILLRARELRIEDVDGPKI